MDLDAEARQFLRAIRAHIDALPAAERLAALLKFVAVMLEYLTREQILTIRAEMVASFGEMNLAEALNLLDGHLALRELQGEEPASN
jgi:ADP-dependent phosphofructokinase/glucokinase